MKKRDNSGRKQEALTSVWMVKFLKCPVTSIPTDGKAKRDKKRKGVNRECLFLDPVSDTFQTLKKY